MSLWLCRRRPTRLRTGCQRTLIIIGGWSSKERTNFCTGCKMPLADFPVKPRTPNRAKEFKLPPQQAKREHRGARVYEPKSPVITRPEFARIYDRPAPILTLPGLPSSPVTGIPKGDKPNGNGFGAKILKTSKEYTILYHLSTTQCNFCFSIIDGLCRSRRLS